MDVVDGEEARDVHSSREGRDEPRHPVVAVDQVRLQLRDGVVDDLPLECKADALGTLRVGRIDPLTVVEDVVLRKVDPLLGDCAGELEPALLVVVEPAGVDVVELPVEGKGDMDIRAHVVEGAHQ